MMQQKPWLTFGLLLLSTLFLSAQPQTTSDYLSRENLEGEEQGIFYTLYQPQGQEIAGTLIILHGMQEHSGRYDAIANFFAQQGYAVLTYDHLGHGRTAKSMEEHGYFLKHKGVEQLVSDALLMSNHLHGLYPQTPHYILGHSMGSFITRAFLQEHSSLFNGAIIVGTGGKVAGIGFVKSYLSVKNSLAPHKKSNTLNGYFANMNNKRFRKEDGAGSTSWLSLSQENQAAFLADSLNGIPFANNGFYTLISVNKRATKKRWAKNISRDFPMLFVSGADDPIGNFGKGITQTTTQLHKQGFIHISTKLYPQMRHEILNEEIQQEVFNDILEWVKGL